MFYNHTMLMMAAKQAVIISLRHIIYAIAAEPESVLSFPKWISLLPHESLLLPTEVEIDCTGYNKLFPLPTKDFQELYDAHIQAKPFLPFMASSYKNNNGWYGKDYNLCTWALQVANACRLLTIAKDDLKINHIKCAGPIPYPDFESQCLLLQGELGDFNDQPYWRADLFLESMSNDGCIIQTHTKQRLEPKQILRSELLTLLVLLEYTNIYALEQNTSATHLPVFLLSFTPTQVRVLEACVDSPNRITISIRLILDEVPIEAEQNKMLQTLICWAMYKKIPPRSASNTANPSAVISHDTTNDGNDGNDGVITGNTSFTEDSEEQKAL
ncbi:hypothetical protein F5Y09DRAFT_320225 [Xylaria sp. FL1042]|nr:hypothetical protein F5Y09DRAFT_320225 [Xylaria sp. FL1042]